MHSVLCSLGRTRSFAATSLAASFCLLISGCQAMPGQQDSTYLGGCAGGAALGAGGALVWDMMKSKKSGQGSTGDTLKRAGLIGAAGCAVGLAATAIGKFLNEREQKKQDEVFEKAAQAGADQAEQERKKVEDRYRTMPAPATDAERRSREQAKQQDIQTAQTKPSNPQSWSEGGTKGEAVYIGPAKSPQTGETIKAADGKDCIKIKEQVWKDGEQRAQESTACRGADGHYTRIELAQT